jgi:hypothetical protein
MYQKISKERLFSFFLVREISSTLKMRLFEKKNFYIDVKSSILVHNYNLSGYLIIDSEVKN